MGFTVPLRHMHACIGPLRQMEKFPRGRASKFGPNTRRWPFSMSRAPVATCFIFLASLRKPLMRDDAAVGLCLKAMTHMPRTPHHSPQGRPLARLSAALALVLGLASHVDAQSASPEPAPVATGPGSVVRETHGAWQVSCRTPPGAKEEKCALVQSVTAEDRPNVGLTVVFYKAIG